MFVLNSNRILFFLLFYSILGEQMITIDYILIIDSVLESIKFTVNMSFLIITTMFIMNYFINSGVMKKLSNFLYPVTKKLKMNQLSLYSILSCFFSPTVGYSILAEGYTEKKITEKELIGSSLANSFPSHIFTYIYVFYTYNDTTPRVNWRSIYFN
ncbi:nucleoside recognition domain-containing protein [Methanococcus vannielii]|uniref:nucleoside recognition domain-containing protein n=1 Tax=Methanococcus vannielii TaxID=2187 RepID=UPI00032541A2